MTNHRDFLAELTSGHSKSVLFGNGGIPRALTVPLLLGMDAAIRWHGDRAERIGCGADQIRAYERLSKMPVGSCTMNGVPVLLDPSVPPDMMVWFRDGVAVGVIVDLQTEDPLTVRVALTNVTLTQPGTVTFVGGPPAKPVCACGDPKCGQPPAALFDGLTPAQCRDRWEANAAAIESGMARPYALSPEQIAEGKRLHLEALKAGR